MLYASTRHGRFEAALNGMLSLCSSQSLMQMARAVLKSMESKKGNLSTWDFVRDEWHRKYAVNLANF